MATERAGIVLLVEAAGGVMRHVIDLYKGLRARGWRVSLVLNPSRLDQRYQDELKELDQSDINYVSMRRGPHTSDLKAFSEIADILKSQSGDTILHAHSTKAGMIGALMHSRVRASVFTPHAYRGVDPTSSRFSKAFLKLIERTYSKDYDRILAVAPAEMEYAKTIGIRQEVLRCIPNGLDTSHIDFSAVFQRRKKVHEPLCLGFVGRLVYQKNPVLFIQVLAEVMRRGRDVRAIIVGDGPIQPEMLQCADQLGVASLIDWRGEIPATGSLPDMDVMVHTSIYEALPYSLIEACADLLPIAATSNYGSEAILRSRLPNNIASSPDAAELATIALSIFENEALRLEQLKALEEIGREFSTDTMISKIEAEYCALASA
jgi:glycosyltransferase involved in cell wall biosynthesis